MEISQLGYGVCPVRDQGALAERVDPVLVPEESEQLVVQRRLEDLDVDLVVLVRVYTEVLDLAQRDGLVFGGDGVGRGVVLGVGTEGADVDLAGRDGAVGVDLRGKSVSAQQHLLWYLRRQR